MAVSGWMKIQATKQGEISKGCNTANSVGNLEQDPGCKFPTDAKDLIQVLSTHHEVELGIDAMSGMATGRRVHKPYVVTKYWDKATPLLHVALVTNEVLSNVEIYFPRPMPDGTRQHYYTVKLTDAVIIDIQSSMERTDDPATSSRAQTETVAFTYSKIEWTMLGASTQGVDSWRAK